LNIGSKSLMLLDLLPKATSHVAGLHKIYLECLTKSLSETKEKCTTTVSMMLHFRALLNLLLLVKLAAPATDQPGQTMQWGAVLKEALLNGSVFLLVGSLVVGVLTAANNPAGAEKMLPFTDKLFYGALSFFLLDMGIVAAQRLRDLREAGTFLIGFSLAMPLFNALIGALIARGIGLETGNALLFVVLCASASYIAVPAAMRMTVPEANPSFYISTALGLTFPFNIVVGIPLYMALVHRLLP
ncbi:MAG: hypothetical protein EBW30_10645, partial [Synechococcaceae bacterium WB7_3xG_012]|nr:hypothetical protein [Synechococcaceae bacterium WB7_3xG_012]